jgi:hypothetical protein
VCVRLYYWFTCVLLSIEPDGMNKLDWSTPVQSCPASLVSKAGSACGRQGLHDLERQRCHAWRPTPPRTWCGRSSLLRSPRTLRRGGPRLHQNARILNPPSVEGQLAMEWPLLSHIWSLSKSSVPRLTPIVSQSLILSYFNNTLNSVCIANRNNVVQLTEHSVLEERTCCRQFPDLPPSHPKNQQTRNSS